jgi:hypothetical protein
VENRLKIAIAILLLLAVAGCRMEQPSNYPATPDSSRSEHANVSAAKVAAIMAANDITLPQVAAFLGAYGYDVVERSAWLKPHWRASTGQVTYYMFRPEIAVADTTVEFMVRGHVPGVWPATVQGVLLLPNGSVMRGPVSPMGWTDNGTGTGALPGMAIE